MADTAPLVAEYMELLTCAVNGPSIEERKTIDPPLASSLFSIETAITEPVQRNSH